jgi:hypothetical protein
MFHIFDMSSARAGGGEHCSHAQRVVPRSDCYVPRSTATTDRLFPMKVVGGYRLLHDLKFLRSLRLPGPTLLLPLAPPAQRLDQRHGIVTDRARCNLEQSEFERPS